MEESQAHPERRSQPRYEVDEDATLVLVNAGEAIPVRIFEISRDGCRIRTARHSPIAAPANVEVLFKVNGIASRLAGVMQWIEQEQVAGIQFGTMAPRRRAALEDLLAELEAEELARGAVQTRAIQQAAEMPERAEGSAGTANERGEPESTMGLCESPAAEKKPVEPAEPESIASAGEAAPRAAPGSRRERRREVRHAVDTRATVFFIDVRAHVAGRILDVSMSGCRIRTGERFPVGIYRRVETEFKVDGLPFRLAGVVQALHDRFTVGIRFLDMSRRKRDQLVQLMEEIGNLN
jgi:hypothetical protein